MHAMHASSRLATTTLQPSSSTHKANGEGHTEKVGAGDVEGAVGLGSLHYKVHRRIARHSAVCYLPPPHVATISSQCLATRLR